tara:strand:- start:1044 stop:1688 length:645 start_codon:yes stop_codon:yes gene_type:complete
MRESSNIDPSIIAFDNDLDNKTLDLFMLSTAIAVDTEAMGLIHGRDRLCLVQISDQKNNVAFIKIASHQTEAPRLQALLENSSIEKVFHFARFDVAALKQCLNIEVNPLFCTKVASKIARTYTPRHGLKDLIIELVGVELDKRYQSSDWGRKDNLTKEQMLYAANDVLYLLQAREKLENMLKREGRWSIAKRCFKCIPVMSDLDRLQFSQIFDH